MWVDWFKYSKTANKSTYCYAVNIPTDKNVLMFFLIKN